ncbi:hypothetical protein [Flavobacterium wongokense]|uniref:hypothetical protein n=1 Tax=Flavobacterium wongokense TaxID=2910674 RepID=UPI001F47AE9E|nr:hypothetical protein [Flavobacterium sp. WG47]MCF6132396.1 hypothetical protein [Flavobacterium sp. WG47]
MKSKLTIVLFTIAIVFALGYASIYFFGDYGWTVFIFLPFLVGFLPAYFASNKLVMTKRQCYSLSFTTLLVSVLILLIGAIDGLICVSMAVPLWIVIVWFGAYIGYVIKNGKSPLSNFNTVIILAFYSLSFLSFDYINEPDELIPVSTSIVVNAPIGQVWKNMINFDTIAESKEFKQGFPYPISATTKGSGVGAIRYATFTTGTFVQRITKWQEPSLLQFSFETNPPGMKEWNPYCIMHPPHLDGYFKSYKGQFKLKRVGNNVTLLEGTNWYKVDIYPQFYWQPWVNAVIHKVHNRVLENIKKESEIQNAQSRNTSKII